jgi:hypothetical protein
MSIQCARRLSPETLRKNKQQSLSQKIKVIYISDLKDAAAGQV